MVSLSFVSFEDSQLVAKQVMNTPLTYLRIVTLRHLEMKYHVAKLGSPSVIQELDFMNA